MVIAIDAFHIVSLIGAVQGLFLTGALAANRHNRTANRLLAALMFVFTVFLISVVYYTAGLVQTYPHFFGISYPLPWVFGPLVYLYTLAASDRSWRFQARDALHFALPLVIVIASVPVYLMSGADKVAMFERFQAGSAAIPTYIRMLDPTKYISGLGYSAATVAYLRVHRRRIEDSYSNTERVNVTWLLWLSGAAAVGWVIATITGFTDAVPIAIRRRGDDLEALGVAIIVYAIGYMGLRQPEVFRYETAEYPVPPKNAFAPGVTPAVTHAVTPASRYERSGLTERQAERLKDGLVAVMEKERPWQDCELTLADLADRLGTTPHKLSEVLNSQLGQTFYDFVNGYRVREVQRRIAAGEAQRVKMLTLALDAGFASKSTFNVVFKKHTSLTPSDYRQTAGA